MRPPRVWHLVPEGPVQSRTTAVDAVGSGSEVHGAIVPTEGQFTDSSGYLEVAQKLRVIR